MAKRTHRPPLGGLGLSDYIEEHIAYEVESVGAAWMVAFGSQKGTAERRCAVEALLLHLRNLHDFFARSERSKKGDILAIDACPQWPCVEILSKGDRDRCKALLAHPTIDRIRGSGHDLPLTDLVVRSLDVAGRWAELLPDGSAKQTVLLRRFEAVASLRRSMASAPVDSSVL